MDLMSTTALIGIITPLHIPGNFLRRLFFGGPVIEFDDETVKFDRVFDDLRVAPWVSPYAPGTPMQDRTFQTDTFAPGYVKPINHITAKNFSKRRPGEAIGGEFTLAQRRELYFVDVLEGHKKKIERREEIMAADILRTGGVVIEGLEYPRAVVNYGRKASLTKTLLGDARWTQPGVSPVDSLEAFLQEVADAGNAAPSHVVMDSLAGQLLKADPKLEKKLDTTFQGNTSAVDLGFKPGVPGAPTYLGRIGNVELYIYNDLYEDENKVMRRLLPDYTVIVGAPGAFEGTPCYGAILDPMNDYGAARMFSKNWIEQNPGAEYCMTQSAPIFVPKRPNTSGCMTVG
ncbi:major capsid protein [Sphingomonas sp. CFBP 8760]|uniref:major capsid protein n=1 Tax=Sphingomonas sp. CFBP 8760 TaxID=2775282 RepID=UPI001786FCDB|nr:major capsid protein [Sphingomonas sp. CFBP 8760]MBD8548010.1 major capsid protein [Sphingomonas sp. CFBP 8760]